MNHTALNELHIWARNYKSINKKRLDSTYFLADKLIPKHTAALNVFIFITLWIFAIDDIYDDKRKKYSELIEFKDLLSNFINKNETNPNNTYSEIISLLRDINKKIQFENEVFNSLNKSALNKMVKGMFGESQNQFKDIKSYLKWGSYTIGLPTVILYTHIVTSAPIFTKDNKDLIKELTEYSGLIIRLLNDKRSYRKEQLNKKLNSISILRNSGKSSKESLELINAYIHKYKEKIKDTKYSNIKRMQMFCIKLVKIVEEFYKENDFHKFTN